MEERGGILVLAAVMPEVKHKWWAILLGVGLALSPTLSGVAVIELVALGAGFLVYSNWDRVKQIGLGNRVTVTCLLVVLVAIALSGIPMQPFSHKFGPALVAVCLFAVYLAGRIVGKDIFWLLGIGVAVTCAGVLVYATVNPGETSGGYIFNTHFDLFVGYVVLGTVIFFYTKYRWLLASAVLVALLLSGVPEAILPIGALALVVVIRRDWNRKLLYVGGVLVVIAAVLLVSGAGKDLYTYAWQSASNTHTVVNPKDRDGNIVEGTYSPIGWRWTVIENAIQDIEPLGSGYNATNFTDDMVHNVPLVVVQQTGYFGILAALAWLVMCFYGLVKTKWKYAWVAILVLGVFDHFIWTQLQFIVFAVAGASAVAVNSDLLFRRDEVTA